MRCCYTSITKQSNRRYGCDEFFSFFPNSHHRNQAGPRFFLGRSKRHSQDIQSFLPPEMFSNNTNLNRSNSNRSNNGRNSHISPTPSRTSTALGSIAKAKKSERRYVFHCIPARVGLGMFVPLLFFFAIFMIVAGALVGGRLGSYLPFLNYPGLISWLFISQPCQKILTSCDNLSTHKLLHCPRHRRNRVGSSPLE